MSSPAFDLARFAKIRALHDGAATAGEREAAAGRMEAAARSAGMTTAEAVSKLDRLKSKVAPTSHAQATADAFNEFFNRPEFVAE